MTICLDTHVLIWGIKEQAEPGQEAMIPRAKTYFAHLQKNSAQVLLPAIVVAELLMRIPPELHSTVTNLMHGSFHVAPFDVKAAMTFSRIWQSKRDSPEMKSLLADPKVKREELKADCMIVATAVAQEADSIVSHDKKLNIFAEGFIKCIEIPEIAEQMELLNERTDNG
jgi:predicted nucleic acid-binding protein